MYGSREYREGLLDNACRRHMTKDNSLFLSITKINGGKSNLKTTQKERLLELTLLEVSLLY
jgi:hypothetical protein